MKSSGKVCSRPGCDRPHEAHGALLPYIDMLQRKNADDLAFYPLSTLEKALNAGQVIVATRNGDSCGYLWFGSIRSGWPVTIYQACIDYDARRQQKGWELVRDLISMAKAGGATAIRLKCASSALANDFWQTIGFQCVNITRGGVKRGRNINHWWTPIAPTLFLPESVAPSDAPIDLSGYQRMKRTGVVIPSRFSRVHYGSGGGAVGHEGASMIEAGDVVRHEPTRGASRDRAGGAGEDGTPPR